MDKVIRFTLRKTDVYSGKDAIEMLPELLEKLGGRKVLLYTDKGLRDAGLVKKVEKLFKDMELPKIVGIYDAIEQDAVSTTINDCAQYYLENDADSIIALGGGSVLDTAKAVKWMIYNEVTDIHEAFIDGKKIVRWPEAKPIPIPHIAIGTTAGTGGEISNTSIVYNVQQDIKIALMHTFIGANIAIADPKMTVSLPPSLTAYTGFDAFTHATEAFFSKNANPISDAYAKQAISMIAKNIELAVIDGSNIESRNNMLLANMLAISAFKFAIGNAPVHNIAHTIGGKFRVPHGLANAVLIPKVMNNLRELYKPRIREFGNLMGIDNLSYEEDKCFDEVLLHLNTLSRKCGIPKKLDIDLSNIEKLIEDVHNDPTAGNYKIPDISLEKILIETSKINN